MVVHSDDGMDEISICAPTTVSELKNGEVTTFRIKPEDFGLNTASISEIVVADSAASLALISDVLKGEKGAARDIVAMNAGAGIYLSGLANSLEEGIQSAISAIDSGKASDAMNAYICATQEA